MPFAPVPSATGEQPCAAPHPRTPPFPVPSAFVGPPSVTPGPLRRLLLAWFAQSPSRHGPAPPPPARSGRPAAELVRERTGVAHGARRAATARHGPAFRRPGRAGRGRRRGAVAAGPGLSGGRTGRPDAAAGGRGQRGGTTGAAGLAGVGRSGASAGSGGAGRGRAHGGAVVPRGEARRGTAAGLGDRKGATAPRGQFASLAGGRRMAATPRAGVRGRGLAADNAGRGGVGHAPDLVRLVDTVATQCHRVRLRRSCAQPLAFS